jgi:hypothetical protein
MELSLSFARSVVDDAINNTLTETRDAIAVREACRDSTFATRLAGLCCLTEERLLVVINEGITSAQNAHTRQLDRRLRHH